MAQAQDTNSDKPDLPTTKSNPTPFITASTAFNAFDESNKWMRPYFDPINEYERIARARPSEKIDPQLPKVVDGTMAAIVQESPKRVIQQIATGLVECIEYPEYAKIADIVHRNKLIPMYNRMGDALSKHWNMLTKALTYGRSTSYTFFTSTNGVMHTDFIIPYVKDVISEKGKVYAPDSNVRFMRSWYQQRDLVAIINKEKTLEATIRGYKSDWDLPELARFAAGGASAKPADQQTPAERERGVDTGGFEVIHAFQKGVGAEFYSFSPQHEQGKSLRTKTNRDPRGLMPLDDLYCNIDLSNPLGRGQIELSGGIQNLIDQQMQMFQFMMTMLMGPPLQVWGNVDKNRLKFRPNAIWDMGQNGNNKVEPYQVNNEAISNFPNNYGLLKSQIMNLNSSQDHSISSEAGNPAQSKTQAGVQAAESRLGVSDNYLRKQFEAWFNAEAETSINIYFSEMEGTPTMKLEGEDLKDIMKTPASKFVDEDTKELKIPYTQISKVSFKFQVDASSSEVKEDANNAEKLTAALALIQKSEDPTIRAAEVKITKLLLDEIGAEGTDDLFPDENDGQAMQSSLMGSITPIIQQTVMETVQQAMEQQKQDPKPLADSVKFSPNDLTPAERAQVLEQGGVKADPQGHAATPAAVDQAMEIAKTAHSNTMDIHNAATTASQPQPIDPNSPEVIQAKAAAKPAEGGSSKTTQQSSSSSTANEPQPDPENAQDGLHELNPEEQQIVQALLQRGFNEQDAEQAIVMMRNGTPPEEIIATLGAKYANN